MLLSNGRKRNKRKGGRPHIIPTTTEVWTVNMEALFCGTIRNPKTLTSKMTRGMIGLYAFFEESETDVFCHI